MKKIWLIVLAVTGLLILTVAGFVVRDGATVTPVGEGTITLEAGTFEAFRYRSLRQSTYLRITKVISLK